MYVVLQGNIVSFFESFVICRISKQFLIFAYKFLSDNNEKDISRYFGMYVHCVMLPG